MLAGCGGATSSGPPTANTSGPEERSPTSLHGSATVQLQAGPATTASPPGTSLRGDVAAAMKKAATFYREEVATHGGYVYYYSPDLSRRWGEGEATEDQVWVQPPGTPTVGMAYLEAYAATGDPYYLEAATEATEALIYGQLASGGWTNCIDFDPRGRRSAQYRNGKGKGKNYSSLDDGQTPSALQLLIHVDEALDFQHGEIREAAQFALDALLKAQFPNGAFPQVWKGPVTPQPVVAAGYPQYDWKTEGRIKEYWNMYTLNDNVPGYVAETLIDAHRIYGDEEYLAALQRLGDFLLLAQMPDPQPAWAQQYNYDMKPIWARKFEPPAVSGDESQEVIETLMRIYVETGDHNYLQPVPRALAYLKRSLLPDGRLARSYELETNKPLYMSRRGDVYKLTYDDSELPGHYGWKVDSRLDELARQYDVLSRGGDRTTQVPSAADLKPEVRQIISELDGRGRWVSTYQGKPLVGQPKFPLESQYVSSDVFSRNVTTLSAYLASATESR
jgi:PelA/Pel-15E family pectate lyase